MSKRKRARLRKPSPAMAVALLALFVALGGTALATTQGFVLGTFNRVDARSVVTNVKADGTQKPIASSLLTLQNLSTGSGATALGLSVAAGKPPFATGSTTKVVNLNADSLDGVDSKALVRTAKPDTGVLVGEQWHEIEAPGEPQFDWGHDHSSDGGYANLDPAKYNTAAFYKDPLGIVHIKGTIATHNFSFSASCDGFTIFQLPAGYRPALKGIHVTNRQLDIAPDGWVEICTSTDLGQGATIVLDGITFRAAQ